VQRTERPAIAAGLHWTAMDCARPPFPIGKEVCANLPFLEVRADVSVFESMLKLDFSHGPALVRSSPLKPLSLSTDGVIIHRRCNFPTVTLTTRVWYGHWGWVAFR
jgi:hypothetical protein